MRVVAWLMIGVIGISAQSVFAAPLYSIPPAEMTLSTGTCEAGTRNFDLKRLFILQSRTVYWLEGGRTRAAELNREHLFFEYTHDGIVDRDSWIDIAEAVEPERDIDIQTVFGFFDNELVVYWRETYQNRRYRQGLFKLQEGALPELCEGTGGDILSQ